MTPSEQFQRKLEATLKALGMETGYDREAIKLAQEAWIAAQATQVPPNGGNGLE